MDREPTVKLVSDEDVPMEVLAANIQAISEGIKKLRAGRLNERALLVLLRDSTGVSMGDIKRILSGLESLEHDYLKPLGLKADGTTIKTT